MSRFQSYLNTAYFIISNYRGNLPLAQFLKNYFSQHKKYGSRDRKQIAHACYCYYRLGNSLKSLRNEERLKAALFLCNGNAGEWSYLFNEDWITNWSYDLLKKIQFLTTKEPSFKADEIFPFNDELSSSINVNDFNLSHLIQPDLFVRIRPAHTQQVIQKLQVNSISFKKTNEHCITLPNSSGINAILSLNEEAVIQDYSSQRISEFLSAINPQPSTSIWDCCAGSGGKSILAYDVLGSDIKLTATDIRPSVIHNLHKRFNEAGIKHYSALDADITSNIQLPTSNFNIIICDAPCTGSGTWGRTPEQLSFFTKNNIEYYAQKQIAIVSKAIPHLKPGGYFLYITCSVFKKENEDIAEFIKEKFHLQLIKMEYLKGYELKADTLFAALFTSL